MALDSFAMLLEESGLLYLDAIPNEDEVGFENRLRFQKYVYIARSYGLDLGYNYSIYRYGPYSPDLASDYYALAESGERFPYEQYPLPETFNSAGFLNLVTGKSANWLEIAATLLDQHTRFSNNLQLIDHVEAIKCDYSHDYIGSVLGDLRTANLVS